MASCLFSFRFLCLILGPSGTIWHYKSWSTLFLIMASCLHSTKPFPEAIMTDWQLDSEEQTSVKFRSKYKLVIQKMHLKMMSAKWWPFCSGLSVLDHKGWKNDKIVNIRKLNGNVVVLWLQEILQLLLEMKLEMNYKKTEIIIRAFDDASVHQNDSKISKHSLWLTVSLILIFPDCKLNLTLSVVNTYTIFSIKDYCLYSYPWFYDKVTLTHKQLKKNGCIPITVATDALVLTLYVLNFSEGT